MINLSEEIEKVKKEGYSEANAQARVCQDIILYGISKAELKENVTIKGGVVMRNLSKSARRATQDVDIDFIRYSLSEDSIAEFIKKIEVDGEINISIRQPVIELKHRDYNGRRVFVEISDRYGNSLESKMDIGVHKDFNLQQEEYCFDICFQEDGVSLLMNSKEQIIVEKLKSFLRFGTRSTRYKDIFDIFYLSERIDQTVLMKYIQQSIYDDATLPVNDEEELIKRLERVFRDQTFQNRIKKSQKNWVNETIENVLEKTMEFIKSLYGK